MSIWMEDGDLLYLYKQADDKVEQIKILSELNACSERAIINRLEALGVQILSSDFKKTVKPKGGRHRKPEEYDLMFRPLYDDGLSDREISLRTGTSTTAVHNWRQRNQLAPNFKSGWPKDARFGKAVISYERREQTPLSVVPAGDT
ncbi:MAG: hypothetical protein K2N48_07465 [Muribaculaceae bacterium]|nr:hypothetical protein [Muribaculaceae bacterium]